MLFGTRQALCSPQPCFSAGPRVAGLRPHPPPWLGAHGAEAGSSPTGPRCVRGASPGSTSLAGLWLTLRRASVPEMKLPSQRHCRLRARQRKPLKTQDGSRQRDRPGRRRASAVRASRPAGPGRTPGPRPPGPSERSAERPRPADRGSAKERRCEVCAFCHESICPWTGEADHANNPLNSAQPCPGMQREICSPISGERSNQRQQRSKVLEKAIWELLCADKFALEAHIHTCKMTSRHQEFLGKFRTALRPDEKPQALQGHTSPSAALHPPPRPRSMAFRAKRADTSRAGPGVAASQRARPPWLRREPPFVQCSA